ncbi:beta-ketoacyl synthase N-terminal-like domain-containing protein [Streptomyces sp. XY431]|uniref:beta-ketoacyl synthase N-terminal-like domain-containing protein n=1 Tax=Streptomyces sp. XY431 TaxID=1415562 RepID=UPI0007C66708|nr:beta-ketoacyl synthase N-terminal-like domain-containing protein [Streptomyces sp. XY431]
MTEQQQSGTAAPAPTPLTRALDTVRKLRAQLDAASGTGPLAVVGIGLRLPGGITDLDGYWDALAEGRELVGPLPAGRRGPFAAEWERLPHSGGFLDEVMDFDAEFFGMGPAEARGVDPQQRLLLEVAWEALENAALPPDRLDAARTGLFVGITGQEYWDWHTGELDTHWAGGNGHCFTVGRVAYALGLAGPAITVDTACSSSLVSVHLARQALARRECDVALAGGVNLVLSPRATRLHQLAGTLSPDGHCRPFDARANGFARGEGCGVLVLKRLEDARRDGDRVHAVVHGSAVNQTGRSTGFTAPNVLSEVALTEAALADAGLVAADIGLVEAHGTGTSLGDTIEMEAIAAALGRRNGGAELSVGSVKANLGHPESAAGVIALVKAVLCLRRREVPPLVNFSTLNPLIDLDGTAITLPTALRPWPERGGRHAAVSAFGMGGTNAQVILGAAEDAPVDGAGAVPVVGFELSARTPEAVRALAGALHGRLAGLPEGSYPAFAYTAGAGRARHRWRARIAAADRAAALRALSGLAEGGAPSGVVLAEREQHDRDEADGGFAGLPRAVLDLPNYPWQRRRYAPEAPGAQAPAVQPPAEERPPTVEQPTAEEGAGRALFALEWAEAEHGTGAPAGAPGRWLLFADRAGTADALGAELVARRGSWVTVTAGSSSRRIDPLRYELDPARPEDLAALLKELRAASDEPWAGVLYAWGLDAAGGPAPEGPGPFPLPAAREDAVRPAPLLVRELADEGLPGGPRLVLLTRGAQRVTERDGAPDPVQALLWGAAGVASAGTDSPHPLLVDLDPDPARDDAARLLEVLLHPAGEPSAALRGPVGYAPVRVPQDSADGTEPAWQRRPFDPELDTNQRLLAVRPGLLESLTPTRWERTAPGPGQVEIEVAAAGLNFSDVLKAMGAYPGAAGTVPLGVECAGRVSAVGAGVERFRVGDRVMAVAPSALAAYTTTEAHLVAPRPSALDDEQAAAVPVAFLTAVYGLGHLARLRAGETVLVHSASGGVGLAALAVARRCGARVFATAGTPAKRRFLRELGGVDLVMDSRSTDFAAEVEAATGGRGVDVVLNSLTGEALRRGLALLAPGGRFVELGKRDIHEDSPIGLGGLKANRALFAVDLDHTFHAQPELLAELFEEVVRGFEDGGFGPLPVTVHPFAGAREAFAAMAQARHTGKLVLRPEPAPELAVPPTRSVVRARAGYLVTGGTTPAALAAARRLADLGARRIALLRSPGSGADAAAEPAVAELRARGVEMVLPVADLSSAEELAAAVAAFDTPAAPLAGVVHLAGAEAAAGAADGTADGGGPEEAEDDPLGAAGPAADAWRLHLATAGRPLDFLVLSDPASAPGRGTALGACLDALAGHRRAVGLPALSVDGAGLASLARLLGSPAAIVRSAGGAGSPGAGSPEAGPAAADSDGGEAVRRQLLAVEPGRRRRALLVRHCRELAARVLDGPDAGAPDAAAIDSSAPLAGLGFDSMRTLELRSRLELSLGVPLPATLGWQYPTLDALVPFLAERMGIPLEAAAAPEVLERPDRPDVAVHRFHGSDVDLHGGPEAPEDLDGLSERELEALLLAKTEQFDTSADPTDRGQGR